MPTHRFLLDVLVDLEASDGLLHLEAHGDGEQAGSLYLVVSQVELGDGVAVGYVLGQCHRTCN